MATTTKWGYRTDVSTLGADTQGRTGHKAGRDTRQDSTQGRTGRMASRDRVLALYRQIMRLSRTWEAESGKAMDTRTERKYILTEARELFRKNKAVTDESEVAEFLREADSRVQLALHYRIPYPRPTNIPQHTLPPGGRKLKSQKRSTEQSNPIYLKSYKGSRDTF